MHESSSPYSFWEVALERKTWKQEEESHAQAEQTEAHYNGRLQSEELSEPTFVLIQMIGFRSSRDNLYDCRFIIYRLLQFYLALDCHLTMIPHNEVHHHCRCCHSTLCSRCQSNSRCLEQLCCLWHTITH